MTLRILLLSSLCILIPAQEQERKSYDAIYAETPVFNTAPNAFLVRMMTGRKAGSALDAGMGQGRNALWLAQHGWSVTGFDVSPVAVDHARKAAQERGLRIDAVVAPHQQFNWGKEKWDLIVFSYFFPQEALDKVWLSLKPGGLILIEGFHSDTARQRPIGGGFRNNELLRILKDYRILIYEDVQDRQDWGLAFGATNRLVRVLAQKPAPLPSGCTWEGSSYNVGESMCWGVGRWDCSGEGWRSAGKCNP